MLNKIYLEQKKMNRNLQRISNVILMAMFGMIGRDAKEKGDEQGKNLCKVGLCLIAITQGLLLISGITDIVKGRKGIECDEKEN